MDLFLKDKTVLLYGSGDYLDGVILRALAQEGAKVLAATTSSDDEFMMPLVPGHPHWSSTETEFDESVGERLILFLRDQNRAPSAVVAHIDLEVLKSAPDRPRRWWRSQFSETSLMLGVLRAVIAAIPATGNCNVVFVYQLQQEGDEYGAYKWLEAAMASVIHHADTEQMLDVRVNSLVVGHDDAFPEAGDLVTYLCSPLAKRVSGSFITVDDGSILRRT